MNKRSLVCVILLLIAAISPAWDTREEEKFYRMIRDKEYSKAEKFCKSQRGAFQNNCYRILAGAQFGPQIVEWVLQSEDEKIEKLCQGLKPPMQQECMRIAGDAYLENEKLDKATQFFEKANYPDGFNRIAYHYLKNGDYENAGKYFDRGLLSALRAIGYGKLAGQYKNRGQIDLAGKYFTAAIADYESLLRNIDYKWNQADCQERLRLIKENESLPKSSQEQSEQTSLTQILKKCAIYCSKLEQAVFHFYCREEVYERLYYVDGYSHSEKSEETLRRFDYEYQVIRDKEQISENRKPLRIDKVPFRKSQSMQKPIAFRHHYLIYGPIILFSENRQPFYKYRILKEEIINGEKIVIIEALPLYYQEQALQFGNVHVKESDGSVVGIDWNPKSIRNFQSILEQAGELGVSPRISFFLEFNVVKNNLHFPSKCHVKWDLDYIDDRVITDARKKGYALTGVVTDIIYKNYKFFTVGTQVVEEEIDSI